MIAKKNIKNYSFNSKVLKIHGKEEQKFHLPFLLTDNYSSKFTGSGPYAKLIESPRWNNKDFLVKGSNMATTHAKNETKKTPAKLSRYRKEKIKQAQQEGGFSDVATSHTSKEKILKAVKKKVKQ